jgi:DNA-binding CsgD family transcriptional regulator
MAAGRWSEVAAAGVEVLDLADAINQANQRVLPLAQQALIEAVRGGADSARLIEAAETAHAANPVGVLDDIIRDVLNWAQAACTRDDPARALHHLTQVRDASLRRCTVIDRVEAAVQAGRADAATEAIEDAAAFAAATGAAWAAAAADHGRALMAESVQAEGFFQSALEHHSTSTRTLSRARTQLAYGEYLRRARRRVDARGHLRSALTTFEDLGIKPLADRAREELRASGETVRRKDDSGSVVLTPQEAQVARLVQEGLANKDVAARLFVSPRTVDFHLRNVFTKLGISSRGALTQIDVDTVA